MSSAVGADWSLRLDEIAGWIFELAHTEDAAHLSWRALTAQQLEQVQIDAHARSRGVRETLPIALSLETFTTCVTAVRDWVDPTTGLVLATLPRSRWAEIPAEARNIVGSAILDASMLPPVVLGGSSPQSPAGTAGSTP